MACSCPSTASRRGLNGNFGSWRWPVVRAALLSLVAAVSLNALPPREYDVKAAFLFNFAKFVEWPSQAFADPSALLVIGVLGDDPFGDVLPQIARGQTAQGRRIEVRRFTENEDYSKCHVLFVSRSVAGQSENILRRLKGRPVLTVGDHEDFVRQGGVVGFAMADKTVRFDINVKAAEAVELKLNSKLLAVARSVVKSP
jgi:hypothetical protein